MGKVNMMIITIIIIFLTVISAFIDLNVVGKINFIIDIIRNIIVVIIEYLFFCHWLWVSPIENVDDVPRYIYPNFLSLHCCWYFCCDDRHRAMNSTVITCSINLINDRAKVLFEMCYCFFFFFRSHATTVLILCFFSFILFSLPDFRSFYEALWHENNFQLSASKAERIVITAISRKPNLCLPWLIIWRKTNLGQMISRDGRARGDVSSPQRTLL